MQQQTTDAASIELLRRLRAGDDSLPFVHQADVCSAAPEDLVASLQPVPGTEGYGCVWYIFCAKKFKNASGKASGHRQRAIVGGDTCWRAEISAKKVDGCDGATFCNLSYGRKMNGGSFDRLGWCMVEYDDSTSTDGGGDNNYYVLCKIYRSSSSLAKGKSKSSTSSTTTRSTTSSSSKSKRKAAATDQPADARPAKFAHHEQQFNTPFTNDYHRDQSQYVDVDLAILGVGDGNRHGVRQQQQRVHQEVAGGFINAEYGPLNQGGDEVIQMQCGLVAPVVNQATVDEMLGPDAETMYGGVMPTAAPAQDDDEFFGEQIQQQLQQHGLPHPVQMEEPLHTQEPPVQQQEEEPEAWAAVEDRPEVPATKKIFHEEEQEDVQQHATTFSNDDHAFDQPLVDILSQDDLECLHHILQCTSFNNDDDDYAAAYYDPQLYLEHMQQEGTFNIDDCSMCYGTVITDQQPSAGIC